MKTYILRKDTPVSTAGEKVIVSKDVYIDSTKDGRTHIREYKSKSGEYFNADIVENNPKWFVEYKGTERSLWIHDLTAWEDGIELSLKPYKCDLEDYKNDDNEKLNPIKIWQGLIDGKLKIVK